MAIHIRNNPHAGTREMVGRYVDRPESRPLLSDVSIESLDISDAYPVYVVTLEELAAGRLPSAPHHWRHLLLNEAGAIGEADLDANGNRIIALHRGPRARGTARAFAEAHTFDCADGRDFELRLLESSAIYLVAIWLHAPSDDWLVPVEPDQTHLEHHRPVPLAEALPRLRKLAESVMRMQAASPGPSGG